MAASPPPSPKRLKMSSTASDEEEPTAAGAAPDGAAPRPRRYKRRKIAIFLAYCGAGYQGMQKNPGARTIESDLEEALFLAGAVPEADRCQPKRYDWARSARTDKGVSAAAQVVSGRFFIDPPGLVDRLNSFLSPQIRVFGFKRATASFNSKKFCDRRRYVYLLPVFALDPSAHPDREAVAANADLARCLECSERGRKVPKEECDSPIEDEPKFPSLAPKASEFRYGEQEKERFNAILKRYVGTHNFHNLTTRTKAEDPSAKRYIISFTADKVVNLDGIDFVQCEVLGQSFMLHQIRKMIGLAVAIMRNCAPETLMDAALRKDVSINVPTAPEVGLYLDECFFTSYNQKWKDTHEELSMESYKEQAEEFKMKYIISHIAAMEHKEGAVALWLHSLNHRNYPDFLYREPNGDSGNTEKAREECTAEKIQDEIVGTEKTQEGSVGAEKAEKEHVSTEKTQEEGCVDAEKTQEGCVDAEKTRQEHAAAEKTQAEGVNTENIQKEFVSTESPRGGCGSSENAEEKHIKTESTQAECLNHEKTPVECINSDVMKVDNMVE